MGKSALSQSESWMPSRFESVSFDLGGNCDDLSHKVFLFTVIMNRTVYIHFISCSSCPVPDLITGIVVPDLITGILVPDLITGILVPDLITVIVVPDLMTVILVHGPMTDILVANLMTGILVAWTWWCRSASLELQVR